MGTILYLAHHKPSIMKSKFFCPNLLIPRAGILSLMGGHKALGRCSCHLPDTVAQHPVNCKALRCICSQWHWLIGIHMYAHVYSCVWACFNNLQEKAFQWAFAQFRHRLNDVAWVAYLILDLIIPPRHYFLEPENC